MEIYMKSFENFPYATPSSIMRSTSYTLLTSYLSSLIKSLACIIIRPVSLIELNSINKLDSGLIPSVSAFITLISKEFGHPYPISMQLRPND